jgi:hypothetical protein
MHIPDSTAATIDNTTTAAASSQQMDSPMNDFNSTTTEISTSNTVAAAAGTKRKLNDGGTPNVVVVDGSIETAALAAEENDNNDSDQDSEKKKRVKKLRSCTGAAAVEVPTSILPTISSNSDIDHTEQPTTTEQIAPSPPPPEADTGRPRRFSSKYESLNGTSGDASKDMADSSSDVNVRRQRGRPSQKIEDGLSTNLEGQVRQPNDEERNIMSEAAPQNSDVIANEEGLGNAKAARSEDDVKENSKDHLPLVPVRKRGRPPKKSLTDVVAIEEGVGNAKAAGSEEDVEGNSFDHLPLAPVRKRGRPPKKSLTDVVAIEDGVGNAKAAGSEDDVKENSKDHLHLVPVRKRGRPPKKSLTNNTISSNIASTNNVVSTKVLENIEQQTAAMEMAVSGVSQQDPHQQTTQHQQEQSEAPVVRRRGRPPRRKTAEGALESSSFSSSANSRAQQQNSQMDVDQESTLSHSREEEATETSRRASLRVRGQGQKSIREEDSVPSEEDAEMVTGQATKPGNDTSSVPSQRWNLRQSSRSFNNENQQQQLNRRHSEPPQPTSHTITSTFKKPRNSLNRTSSSSLLSPAKPSITTIGSCAIASLQTSTACTIQPYLPTLSTIHIRPIPSLPTATKPAYAKNKKRRKYKLKPPSQKSQLRQIRNLFQLPTPTLFCEHYKEGYSFNGAMMEFAMRGMLGRDIMEQASARGLDLSEPNQTIQEAGENAETNEGETMMEVDGDYANSGGKGEQEEEGSDGHVDAEENDIDQVRLGLLKDVVSWPSKPTRFVLALYESYRDLPLAMASADSFSASSSGGVKKGIPTGWVKKSGLTKGVLTGTTVMYPPTFNLDVKPRKEEGVKRRKSFRGSGAEVGAEKKTDAAVIVFAEGGASAVDEEEEFWTEDEFDVEEEDSSDESDDYDEEDEEESEVSGLSDAEDGRAFGTRRMASKAKKYNGSNRKNSVSSSTTGTISPTRKQPKEKEKKEPKPKVKRTRIGKVAKQAEELWDGPQEMKELYAKKPYLNAGLYSCDFRYGSTGSATVATTETSVDINPAESSVSVEGSTENMAASSFSELNGLGSADVNQSATNTKMITTTDAKQKERKLYWEEGRKFKFGLPKSFGMTLLETEEDFEMPYDLMFFMEVRRQALLVNDKQALFFSKVGHLY